MRRRSPVTTITVTAKNSLKSSETGVGGVPYGASEVIV